jgi:hypothetical protein
MYEFIQDHLRYPDKAKYNQTEGRVLIAFMIDVNGDMKDLYIKKRYWRLLWRISHVCYFSNA